MFSMRKLHFILTAIALFSLAGCGQYGPLYLPDRPAPRDKQDSEFDALPPKLDKSRQP